MRSTCAVYVDAGYLLASAATRVTGTSLRNGVHVDFPDLIKEILRAAHDLSGLPVLRLHWYDSAKNGVPDPQQERIGELPRVKLRLGRFGVDGQQKGVDLRIGLDMAAHARNHASDVFVLLSGDDDLTEAVEEAQVHGVQVTVMAVPTADGKPHGVSRHLIRAADDLSLLPGAAIDRTVIRRLVTPETPQPIPVPVPKPRPKPAAPAFPTPNDLAAHPRPPAAQPVSATVAYSGVTGGPAHVMPGYDYADDAGDDQIDAVVTKVLTAYRQSATPQDLADLRRGRPSIPRDIDRALLVDASEVLDAEDLSERIRYRLRDRFWDKVAELL
ncbi:NYN domain-containing protein [Nocardia thailandica]|uniref:NYN domain-containing protein n=1 Tax=Nocardia thailandica TaxID=257275 RepID=A0ABW6PIG5_9NOCA